ncbi:alpha/beta hydrolase [Solemya elarraichensis gill symbiont]|uniref:Serine aminopeptidase S33 domain-containing protein n=1 Tax=Solemya elarraichensis gill symbiont TaxID=1918949 RepID=A0A1T2L0I0_9GAMM|nr:alpha/beta fold hydrolase [Solemya elarraichensis gill symbiont]OOZ38456.1 hypothetical protein BOW52_08515 [Solemya elarraichensis gill symbiont]
MNEKHVSIKTDNGTIRGMLHEPTCIDKDLLLIVIIHGYFSANRVGPSRLYLEISRYLCEKGYCVLRCDALGVGDSDGNFSDVTFKSELRDFRIVCEYATNLYLGNQIVLIGHSMGANLALRLTKDTDSVSGALMLAPAIELRGGTDQLFDDTQRVELAHQGWTLRKGLHINAKFIDEIKYDFAIGIAGQISKPFVVIQGEADELYDPIGAKLLARSNNIGRLVSIPMSDHNFLAPFRSNLLTTILNELTQLQSLSDGPIYDLPN